MAELKSARGKVKSFNVEKGFGFFTVEETGDVFVHKTVLRSCGIHQPLERGQEFVFDVYLEPNKGLRARNVSRAPNGAAHEEKT